MLEVKPVALEPDERPVILSGCPGQVFRIDERVIDACSFTEVMARRDQGLIFQAPAGSTVNFQRQSDGFVTGVELMGGPTEPPVSRASRGSPDLATAATTRAG